MCCYVRYANSLTSVRGLAVAKRPCDCSYLIFARIAPAVTPNTNSSINTNKKSTLISKVQSTSDLDYFRARDLPCSRVKSHDDPISDRRGDRSSVFLYKLR